MKSRRILASLASYAVLIVILLISLEAGSRLFWARQGAGFWSAQRNLYLKFYPQLRNFETRDDPCSDCFDVLMLGGSALTRTYGSIEDILMEELSRLTTLRVRVFNLAALGHSSLDSYYKYRHLGNRHFDLVLVYEAINEARANDFPPELFRSDYSQFPWYAMINAEEQGFGTRRFVFPYSVQFAYINTRRSSDVAMPHPKAEWMQYGCDVKTVPSFRANVQGIVDMAAHRGDRVLLMTYAYWLAPGYSENKMLNRELAYTRHLFPVEEWGKPECVTAAVDAHNAAMREIAQAHPETLFVDQAELMPKGGKFYNDICHMTNLGSQYFVKNMLGAVGRILPKGKRRDLSEAAD